MTSGSLDTNVLLRLILNDVPEQRVAAKKLLANGDKFDVSDMAINELVFVLGKNYGMSRSDIATVVSGFLADEQFNYNQRLVQDVLPIFAEHSALSFEDCCLAVYAELNDAKPLHTFDRKLASQLSQAELVA